MTSKQTQYRRAIRPVPRPSSTRTVADFLAWIAEEREVVESIVEESGCEQHGRADAAVRASRRLLELRTAAEVVRIFLVAGDNRNRIGGGEDW